MDKEMITMISRIKDQSRDIFRHFDAVANFELERKDNPWGGNPKYIITLSLSAPIPMKEKTFERQPAYKTAEMVENEIKAYLYDCIDTLITLG